MKKIYVDICMGTTCHIFGASDLLRIADMLEEPLKDCVEIRGVPCLNACRKDNFGGAPFVRIDGKLVSKADVNSVMEILRSKLEEGAL